MRDGYDVPQLLASRTQIDAWCEAQRGNGVMEVDINDQLVVMSVARLLFIEQPELRIALQQKTGEAMHDALRLGMFAGVANLLRLIGYEDGDFEELVFRVLGR